MYHNIRSPIVFALMAGLLLAACTPKTAVEKLAPAYVETIEGTDLNRVVLTAQAAERLDIQTVAVRDEPAAQQWTVGGEVVALPDTNALAPSGVWVRVRFTENDRNKVDLTQSALILPLDGSDEGDDEDGLIGNVDEAEDGDDSEESDTGDEVLYYVVDNAAHGLTPGQRVMVVLSRSTDGAPRKVVPYSAVIYDLHGQTWVYTNPEPLVFIRYRIVVDYIEADRAILSEGPPVGAEVVSVGATELYGVESGVGGH